MEEALDPTQEAHSAALRRGEKEMRARRNYLEIKMVIPYIAKTLYSLQNILWC